MSPHPSHAHTRNTHTRTQKNGSVLLAELDAEDLDELLAALERKGIKKPHRKLLEKRLRALVAEAGIGT